MKEEYFIHASLAQKEVLLYQWRQAWQQIAEERKRSRLIVVMNGDQVDGNHHHTEQLVTNNIAEQQRMFAAVMQEALDTARFNAKKDILYSMSGTPAHGDNTSEEAVGRILKSKPHTPPTIGHDGRYAWPRLRLSVNGQIIDIAHEGAGVGRRMWTQENVLRSTIKSIYFDSIDAGKKPPRFYVRSHRHKWIDPQSFSGRQGTITGLITPAMQLKTEFAHKVAGDEILSTVGVAWLVIEDDPCQSRWDASLYQYEDETALEVVE